MSPAPAARRGWEVQVHPAGGRRRVRYFQVTPALRNGLVAAGVLLVLVVAAGLVLLPRLWSDLVAVHPEGAAGLERAQELRRLQAQLQRVDELYPRAQRVRHDLQTLLLAYGLEEQRLPPAAPGEPGAAPPANAAEAVARGQVLLAETERELVRAEALGQAVEGHQQHDPAGARGTPSIRPLAVDSDSFVLVSGFGERQDPFTDRRQFHAGIDLAAPEGTRVVATADGVVAFAGSFNAGTASGWWRYGNLILLAHGDGLVTVYGHCRDLSVRQGQRVRRGEVIATVGNTGWSRVPHLHYEVRRRSGGRFRPEDPRLFMLDPAWGDPDQLLAEARGALQGAEIEPLPAGLEN